MSRRSENIALTTLVASLGAIAVISAVENRQQPEQQRNRYASKADCACEYSENQCSYDYGNGRYLGPWYARDPVDRRHDMDDPGPGRSCSYSSGAHTFGGGSYGRAIPALEEGRTVRTGVEIAGSRGGFGQTGRRIGGFRFSG